MKVPPLRSRISPAELYGALRLSWRCLFGVDPSPDSILVLMAQWALETGHGKSCYCHNLGNVKSNLKSGDWYFMRCWEIIDGEKVWIDPDNPGCAFKAYNDLFTATLAHLETLSIRYAKSWSAVLAGDPSQFCALLKKQYYYSGNEAEYTSSVVSIYNSYKKLLRVS